MSAPNAGAAGHSDNGLGAPRVGSPAVSVRRALGSGLWKIRTDPRTKRTARVLLCLYWEYLVALHGFVKKTRATPDEDLALARKRKRQLEQ